MIKHDRKEWCERAYGHGSYSIECLNNRSNSASGSIIHREGRVFVRLSYFRSGKLHEHFLEIPDSE